MSMNKAQQSEELKAPPADTQVQFLSKSQQDFSVDIDKITVKFIWKGNGS